jgi:hypothetical protein
MAGVVVSENGAVPFNSYRYWNGESERSAVWPRPESSRIEAFGQSSWLRFYPIARITVERVRELISAVRHTAAGPAGTGSVEKTVERNEVSFGAA